MIGSIESFLDNVGWVVGIKKIASKFFAVKYKFLGWQFFLPQMEGGRQADVEMTSSATDLPINALGSDDQSDDVLLGSSGTSTPTRMEGVDSITDLVTNVSLQENNVPGTASGGGTANVSSNFHTPLPQRIKPSRSRRSQSVTSFVSASSSPENSITTIQKSQRTIETYLVRSGKNHSTPKDTGINNQGNTSTPIKQPSKTTPAPNIVAEILAERNTQQATSGPSVSSSESSTRAAKRKRNTSNKTDNYVEVRATATDTPSPPPEEGDIQDIIHPTTSDILLAESGRPTQTAVTFVSDNKGRSVNSLSVSFQVPAMESRDPTGTDPPSRQDEGPPKPDIPAVNLSWMKQIQMDYFLTTRASVVSEARAKLRGMMLGQCTDNDLIHPWALHMAPMPVYLSPHADLLVPFLKQQALELQRFCSDTLLEYAEFQNKKIEVDKDSGRSCTTI